MLELINSSPLGYQLTELELDLFITIDHIFHVEGKYPGLKSRVTFAHIANPTHIYYQDRIDWYDVSKRDGMAGRMVDRLKSLPRIKIMLDELALTISREYERGEPVLTVGTSPTSKSQRFLCHPFLLEGQTAMIYGQGGSFKSMFAILLALSVQTGIPMCGLTPTQRNVLYLDNETTANTINARVRAISFGQRLPENSGFTYRRCVLPLAADVENISRIIYEREIGLVVVDSVGKAVGGDASEQSMAAAMFQAVDKLGTTTLLLHHEPYREEKDGKRAVSNKPFGSVYFINYTRILWHIIRHDSQGIVEFPFSLQLDKANDLPLKTYGTDYTIRFTQEEGQEKIIICRQTPDTRTSL